MTVPRRVYLHIGLPKTGTTYLQQILWGNKELLGRHGLLLPGRGHRDHLWAALDLQGRPNLARRDPKAVGSWGRLVDEVGRYDGNALITHEFLASAGKRQARSAAEAFPGAEVHVIVTARDAAGLLAAGWQEQVKNGGFLTLDEATDADRDTAVEFSWRTWNLRGVLSRWSAHLEPSHVHVLPLPGRDQPRQRHWENFASVIGVPTAGLRVPEQAANATLGVAQTEMLRRLNPHLTSFARPRDRGEWIRGYLGEHHLGTQPGDSIALTPRALEVARRRSERAVEFIRDRGFDVRGELTSLLVPDPGARGSRPDEVSAEELLDAALKLLADIMLDVRRLSRDKPRDAMAPGRRSGADAGEAHVES